MLKRNDPKTTGYTADTPVPYRLADLVALIDERMGKLENRSSRMVYHKLITRIETVRNDPRYAFMFDNANVGGDTMGETLRQLFRLPSDGKPMTIMQLAGFPAEVVDSVVSVLCRMAFDFGLWSDGAFPLLFVCEEAHRYASADRSIGFGPTRKALSRIAKEGRKYGVFLGLVTQRPAELDSTIISQCSTLFAMRMANERDQAIVRSAVSDAAANLLAFVPSLGTREVLAFGEGVALPTRLKFKQLPEHLIPHSQAVINASTDNTAAPDGRLHRHDHRPLARRHDEPQGCARRWSRLRIACARGVLVVVSRTAGAERGAAAEHSVAPEPCAAACGGTAARSGTLQAPEAADRGPQRCVRARRTHGTALAEIVSFSGKSDRPERGPRASPSPHSACRKIRATACASHRRILRSS